MANCKKCGDAISDEQAQNFKGKCPQCIRSERSTRSYSGPGDNPSKAKRILAQIGIFLGIFIGFFLISTIALILVSYDYLLFIILMYILLVGTSNKESIKERGYTLAIRRTLSFSLFFYMVFLVYLFFYI